MGYTKFAGFAFKLYLSCVQFDDTIWHTDYMEPYGLYESLFVLKTVRLGSQGLDKAPRNETTIHFIAKKYSYGIKP